MTLDNNKLSTGAVIAAFAAIVAFSYVAWICTEYPDRDVLAEEHVSHASIISDRLDGRPTKSGELMDGHAYVCAVKPGRFDWGQWLRVSTVRDFPRRVVYVRVVDQMSEKATADIDLSNAAAALLFPAGRGRCEVKIEKP